MIETDKTKFSLNYLIAGEGIKDWYKALGNGWRIAVIVTLGAFLILGIRGCFVKQPQNINKPHVIVTPFAKVEKIDQTSTQISMTEKTWEAGLGGGAITYDNKSGVGVWGWLKKKW